MMNRGSGGPAPGVASGFSEGNLLKRSFQSARMRGPALFFIVLALLPAVGVSSFQLHLLITIFIIAIATLGFHVVFQVGEVSLAQAGFLAIGAYTTGLLSLRLGVNVWLAMTAGIAASLIVAAGLGRLILRAGGEFYFLLITFAFGEIIRITALTWVGGPDGIPDIPPPTVFGFALSSRTAYYLFTLAVLALTLMGVRALVSGNIGRIFKMVAEGRSDLAPSVGIDTVRYRLLAFTLGGGIGGLAGALYAHYLGFVAPNLFGLPLTVLILTVAVVGGMNSVWGPLVGAVVIIVLRDNLRSLPELHVLIYGVALVIMVLFLREGLVGAAGRLVSAARRRFGFAEVES